MSKRKGWGFTLIELLTVIAIIAILVGITASVLPRVLERARVTRTGADMRSVSTALATHQVDHQGLPPAYGYRRILSDVEDANKDGDKTDICDYYFLQPYTVPAKIFQNYDIYDSNWDAKYDKNGNGVLDLMEFTPVGTATAGGGWTFDLNNGLYDGNEGGALAAEVALQKNPSAVAPYTYFPVNAEQADLFRQLCVINNWVDGPTNDQLQAVASTPATQQLLTQFPPAYYDDYVLVSVGPGGTLAGLIPSTTDSLVDPIQNDGVEPNAPGDDSYYLNALKIFFLASRDANDNSLLDLDFRARTRNGEGIAMPPGSANSYGYLIYPNSPRGRKVQ